MKLYIARHGETDWNKEKKIQGRIDLEMNQTGIFQVNQVAKGLSDVDFDAVYSSPLIRALETAKIIGDNQEVIIDENIYEISFGLLEGAEYGNIREWDPEILDDIKKCVRTFFGFPQSYIPMGDGETYDELLERAKTFLQDMNNKYKGEENILVVTHSTFIHALISIIDKIPLSNLWEIKIPNCSVSVIECKNEDFKVLDLGKVF